MKTRREVIRTLAMGIPLGLLGIGVSASERGRGGPHPEYHLISSGRLYNDYVRDELLGELKQIRTRRAEITEWLDDHAAIGEDTPQELWDGVNREAAIIQEMLG